MPVSRKTLLNANLISADHVGWQTGCQLLLIQLLVIRLRPPIPVCIRRCFRQVAGPLATLSLSENTLAVSSKLLIKNYYSDIIFQHALIWRACHRSHTAIKRGRLLRGPVTLVNIRM